jgi:hypothetical protein
VAGSEAASSTKSATNQAITAQQTAQQRQQQQLSPYTGLGGGAVQQYQNLLGIGGPGQPNPQQTLAATPGYQFAKTEGLTATTNAASAMGLGLSGNTLEGLDKFSTGLADNTYQQAVTNAGNAVTIGENAAAGVGSGILQTGQGVSNALINQGNTIAGIDANTVAGISKSIGGGVNNYITASTLSDLGGYSTPGNYGVPSVGGPAMGITDFGE